MFAIFSEPKTPPTMPFVYGYFRSLLLEKLRRGFGHWSQVQSLLGKAYVLSSCPDFSRHQRSKSYVPISALSDKSTRRQFPKHGRGSNTYWMHARVTDWAKASKFRLSIMGSTTLHDVHWTHPPGVSSCTKLPRKDTISLRTCSFTTSIGSRISAYIFPNW